MIPRLGPLPALLCLALIGACRTPEAGDQPFRMAVGETYTVEGRGTMVTGTIESGSVAVGETLELASSSGGTRRVRVSGLDADRTLESASAGDTVGIFFAGLARGEVEPGDVLRSPVSE